jgi:hypothetical protein
MRRKLITVLLILVGITIAIVTTTPGGGLLGP